MKTLLKYSGLILEIIGVGLLIVPKLMSTTSNLTLVAGGACMIIGVIIYVVINKIIKE